MNGYCLVNHETDTLAVDKLCNPHQSFVRSKNMSGANDGHRESQGRDLVERFSGKRGEARTVVGQLQGGEMTEMGDWVFLIAQAMRV